MQEGEIRLQWSKKGVNVLTFKVKIWYYEYIGVPRAPLFSVLQLKATV